MQVCNAAPIQFESFQYAPFDSALLVHYSALVSCRRLLFKREKSVGKFWKNHSFPDSTRRNFLWSGYFLNPKNVLCSAHQGKSFGMQNVLDISISVFSKLSADVSSQRCEAARIAPSRFRKKFLIVLLL